MRKIRGVKTTVEFAGRRLLLVFSGPENMRVYDDGRNVTRELLAQREQLVALADRNFDAGICRCN